MKKKIVKVLGVVLSLALLSSLAIVSAPVSAAPGTNAWGEIGMPTLEAETGVGVMAVAPDGTIYAAILNAEGSNYWSVWKSVDKGVSWTATKFTGNTSRISDIAISPNYASDGTVYVSRMNADIYRMTGKGADTPILLKSCVDSGVNTATTVYDLDLWYDGSKVWILAATDIDVLVLKDALFEDWKDQQLVPPPANRAAYEVAFAPDFNSSNLIWAVIDNGAGHFQVTSTVSPGQWGLTISNVNLQKQGGAFVDVCEWVDIEFPDGYTSNTPMLYVGCTDLGGGADDGNIFQVRGAVVPGDSEALPLLPVNDDIVSVEVSGNVILAGTYNSAIVYCSYNAGDTFTLALKGPTGTMRFHVYMAPGAFNPSTGVAYCSSQATTGDESAFSYTADGGMTWNQRSWIDTGWTAPINDIAFAPVTASQPALMISQDGVTDSLWRTDDITAANPVWERVLNTTVSGLTYFYWVEYSMNYASDKTIMLSGYNAASSAYELWKSTDNAQTFSYWRTISPDIIWTWDLKVYNSATIYAACVGSYGFLGTSLFGPADKELLGVTGNSIALQPGFNPDDTAKDNLVVGDDSGKVYISNDAGDTWGAAQTTGLTGDVYVAFDQKDATVIYLASSGSTVKTATLDGNKFKTDSLKDLKDSALATATATSFSGLQVAKDNTIYALGGDVTTTPATTAHAISGHIVLTGTDSGAQANVTLTDVVVTKLQGTFIDEEAINIGTPADSFTATGYNSVSGTIYVVDNAGPDAAAYTSMLTFTGLTLLNVAVPFEAGETVTVAETAANDMTIDINHITNPGGTVTGETNLFRLLLGESDNIWEKAPKTGAYGLWLTEGSNTLWAMGSPVTGVLTPTFWALKDTLSGQVTGVAVSDVKETSAKVSWTAMTGAKQYQVKYDTTIVPVPATPSATPATTTTLSPLTHNTTYSVKVRVATGQTFQSRWSTAVSFKTIEAIATPVPEVPAQGLQDAPLLPSFVWAGVSNAVSYEFELGIDPTFTATIVKTTITAPTTAYTCATKLAYDTDHYWRIRAVSATGTKSAWCTTQNFHTMLKPVEPLPPVTIPPQITPTVIVTMPAPIVTVVPPDITVVPPDITVVEPDIILPTPTTTSTTIQIAQPEVETPVYIWIIVAIGAVLTIAVIVLIIRTRRVV